MLVSDNASTDGTEALVRDFCSRHPGLRYLRNATNLGFDGNVVSCIENAAGEYVAFCSDDDLVPAGFLGGLLRDLLDSRPVAAYVNHTPFFHDNPRETAMPTQPVIKRLFTTPTEYFLYAGLGFISALTLKTSEARKHTAKAVHGRGTAHIDIASRTVLASSGPFLFDGTLTVLARTAYDSGYDPLRFGAINTTATHLDLLREGMLTQGDVAWTTARPSGSFFRGSLSITGSGAVRTSSRAGSCWSFTGGTRFSIFTHGPSCWCPRSWCAGSPIPCALSCG